MSPPRWTSADLPDLSGRTVIVTGATSGIGRMAARDLARAGARVVLAVRNPDLGERVASEMQGDTEVRRLDLTQLDSVRAFAGGWEGGIDVLVNNAGVMATPEGRTGDGFELQIGTNHLGHFLLTNLLLEQVRERVVTVSSYAHRMGRIDLDDLNFERRRYRRWVAYGQSKLANMLFAQELARRFDSDASGRRSLVVHPGWSATHLQGQTRNRLQDGVMALGNRLWAQTDEQGAWPTVYAATQDIPNGSFVGPDKLFGLRGHPRLERPSRAGRDPEQARRLWELSERLTAA